jgi:diguanylate cyclase (GGDEF)-like protein
MIDIHHIIERLKENEETARKFHEVETRILGILNFTDLFEVLLTEIREKFNVPYVWLSMIADSEVSHLIASLGASAVLRDRMALVERSSFMELVGHKTHPLLLNQDLKAYYRLLPRNHKYFAKSLAIAPISLDGQIIGSLNQADSAPERFVPGMDASLLERLAVKVSLCLSNVTAHEKLRVLAYQDPLTGLLNRRVMEAVLKREFYRARRYAKPLSVAFLDLDDFKKVNDHYGHDRGDELLKHLADQLNHVSRDSDVVARFAGDEFVVILPETTADNAETLLQRLQDNLGGHPLAIGEDSLPVSISFGVASSEDPAMGSPETLLKKADEKLYRAKSLQRSSKVRRLKAPRPESE